MATRNEKIFKSRTICLMNSILNEINSCAPCSTQIAHAKTQKTITELICKFYDQNNITDEEIRKALTKCPKKQ